MAGQHNDKLNVTINGDKEPWTPFLPAYFDAEDIPILTAAHGVMPEAVYLNATYQVVVTKTRADFDGDDSFPEMLHLSIKRRDRQPIDYNHWRILQRIKNEIVGPEYEAVELYPREGRLMDTSNQYHLWVLANPETVFPFGYARRAVSESSLNGSVQRPFEEDNRPDDLIEETQIREMVEQLQEEADADG